MSFDVLRLRNEFPLFAVSEPLLHYLDSAATSQIHQSALQAVVHYETRQRANVMRGSYRLAEAATGSYEEARAQTARFLNAATPEEIIFTSGTTAALNLIAYAFGATLTPGDEVVISLAEHHS
ncbi:MAG: aminotransferase class V-fold PLP-dependent enzyme, partial [Burkholderiales bacterium]